MAKQSFPNPAWYLCGVDSDFGRGLYIKRPQAAVCKIGQPFPEFSLPDLKNPNQQRSQDEIKGPALVNVWATWCPTCYAEHEALKVIEQTGFGSLVLIMPMIPAARRFLDERGDPYVLNILDTEGRLAIDLGVYGAPETFVIDELGEIQYRM